MTSLVAATFLLGAIFSIRVNGITTKTLPGSINNSTDSSQFVQIRSVLNQPTRAFLVQHKSALSPAQQTHILDDVQKNQRIHYSTDSNPFEDRQKSLFGSSFPSPPPRGKYSDFLNLNSLSPPPVQTVVLSPQQTLPTSPPQVDHLPYFRPITRTDKPTFPHSYSVKTLSEFEPLKVDHELRQEVAKKTPYYQSIPPKDFSSFTSPAPHFPFFSKTDSSNVFALNGYHDKGSESSTPSSTTRSKPYHSKEANSIFNSKGEDKIIKEIVIKTNPEELIAKDRQKFFQQLLDNQSPDEQYEVANSDDQTPAQNDLSNIRSQFEKEFLRRFKENAASSSGPDLSGLIVNSSNAVSEFSLPNGQKIQISKDYNQLLQHEDGNNKIKAIVVKQPGDSSPTPSSNILEELTKGVVPPGVEYEVIKRNKDGALEEVSKLSPNIPQKKVTFVILEEQSDGTVRVQGVRGNAKESLQESGEEVETIIKKIKEGELKLPPSTKLSPKQAQKVDEKRKPEEVKSKRKSPTPPPSKHFVPTPATSTRSESPTTESLLETYKPYFTSPTAYTLSSTSSNGKYRVVPSTPSTDLDQLDASQRWSFSSPSATLFDPSSTPLSSSSISDNYGLFHLNNSGYISNLFTALKNPSVQLTPTDAASILQFPYLPSPSSPTIVDSKAQNFSNAVTKYPSLLQTTDVGSHGTGISSTQAATTSNLANVYKSKRDRHVIRFTTKKPIVTKATTRKDNDEEESNVEELKSTNDSIEGNGTLSDVLKREGFFAMARFLRQSGLDTILNDTGPFTLFIPTDKAFRTLLIQLGGPDKAEEKFKENPRLLSGLLLHHVIPGAFRVNSLQDEMTGVSLAGTQLRVNTYTTHDIEWNDVTVITINGAKVLDDQKDIVIPQGIAHAIDRVMFPLPVGNLLQSLQADRENRYSNFLKVIEESDLSYLLTGAKTFTLFAPLNRAFTHAEFTRIVSDANESKSFVLRHVVPGALYSAGMKYYQVRDSMEDGQQVTVYKEAGKIKVNSAHVITRNIPATNGVIHAIDAFL